MIYNRQIQDVFYSIVHADHCVLDESWNYKNVISPFSRLYLITGGSGKVIHNDQSFLLKKGNMYLIPEFTLSSYESKDYLEQYYLHLMLEMKTENVLFNKLEWKFEEQATPEDHYLFKRLISLNPNRGLLHNDPAYYDNRQNLFNNLKAIPLSDPSSYMESIGILQQLLSRFIKATVPKILSKSRLDDRIRESVHFINGNLDNHLDVKSLAQRSCLSTDYYSNLFNRVMGSRPISYINLKKIERARYLISTTNQDLSEISFLLGFENYNYFSRMFKKHTGLSPRLFRKKIQMEGLNI